MPPNGFRLFGAASLRSGRGGLGPGADGLPLVLGDSAENMDGEGRSMRIDKIVARTRRFWGIVAG